VLLIAPWPLEVLSSAEMGLDTNKAPDIVGTGRLELVEIDANPEEDLELVVRLKKVPED
jgi:hypothetical protein